MRWNARRTGFLVAALGVAGLAFQFTVLWPSRAPPTTVFSVPVPSGSHQVAPRPQSANVQPSTPTIAKVAPAETLPPIFPYEGSGFRNTAKTIVVGPDGNIIPQSSEDGEDSAAAQAAPVDASAAPDEQQPVVQSAVPAPVPPALPTPAPVGDLTVKYNAPTTVPLGVATDYRLIIESAHLTQQADFPSDAAAPLLSQQVPQVLHVKAVMTGDTNVADIGQSGSPACQTVTKNSNPTWDWLVTPKTTSSFLIKVELWDAGPDCTATAPAVTRIASFQIRVTATWWQRFVAFVRFGNAAILSFFATVAAGGAAFGTWKWLAHRQAGPKHATPTKTPVSSGEGARLKPGRERRPQLAPDEQEPAAEEMSPDDP